MDLENVEYWVLRSMEEARISLQNGEVPVGCLFLIQKDVLDRLTSENVNATQRVNSSDLAMELDEAGNSVNGVQNAADGEKDTADTFPKSDLSQHTVGLEIMEDPCKENDKRESDATTKEEKTTRVLTNSMHMEATFLGGPIQVLKEGTEKTLPKEPIQVLKETNTETTLSKKPIEISSLVVNSKYSKRTTVSSENLPTADKSGGFTILARGKNEVSATKNATRHAEMVCVDQTVEMLNARSASVFENVTVVVNLEPCVMCMAALLSLRVRAIVYTCENDRFGYNVLGDSESTNYVEVVEVTKKEAIGGVSEGGLVDQENTALAQDLSLNKDERAPEMIGATGRKKDLLLVESCDEITNTPNSSPGVHLCDSSPSEIAIENSRSKIIELENIQSEIVLENRRSEIEGSKVYRLSFGGKVVQARPNESIESKLPHLVSSERMGLCHVFRYRKYEEETMNILKLFYKGTNPNAPKNKVKIKS